MSRNSASPDEIALRQVIDDRARALRTKDTAAIVQCRAAGLVAFGLAPPLRTPTDSTDGLDAWFATWAGPIGYEITGLDITAGGDVAFAHGISHMSGTKTDGEKPDLWFRETLGLRRLDGRWTIAHLHQSVPFYMDGSFKAAVDLKP